MTNSNQLKEIIKKSGLKIGYIASEMKMSRQSLHKKINNETSFNQYEIVKMCEILDIDKDLRDSLFFCS